MHQYARVGCKNAMRRSRSCVQATTRMFPSRPRSHIPLGGQIMKVAFLTICFIGSAFSQGTYVSNENAASAGLSFGRYNTDAKYGFGCAYSLKGFLDLSFTRSSILTEEHMTNFQNEYFLRLYAPKENRFFFSVGVGYLYQRLITDLWNGFPFVVISDGVAFEGGFHLITEDSKTRRVIASVSYMYFEPNEELQTPTTLAADTKLARSLSLDVAVVYYLNQIGLIIGPRIALDSDFKNVFLGLHSTVLIRH